MNTSATRESVDATAGSFRTKQMDVGTEEIGMLQVLGHGQGAEFRRCFEAESRTSNQKKAGLKKPGN